MDNNDHKTHLKKGTEGSTFSTRSNVSLNSYMTDRYDIVNTRTPRHSFMAGRYKKSFAYYTLKERLPVILTNIIDNLTKEKDEIVSKFGEESRNDLKTIIGQLSELKYKLQTDKELELFTNDMPDKDDWNRLIEQLSKFNNTFFTTCWLYAECYMYRRIKTFFQNSAYLKDFDYFGKQKRTALLVAKNAIEGIVPAFKNLGKNRESFTILLKLQLWGNKCDLSISTGKQIQPSINSFDAINALNSHILINDIDKIWDSLNEKQNSDKLQIIDIVLDNCGFELFSDLILADYLIEKNFAQQIRFHTKALPWFISDVTENDFHFTLNHFSNSSNPALSELGKKWLKYIEQKKFVLEPINYFWTLGYEYYKMRDINPDTYELLKQSRLIIFKGDLNYRKLIGDFAWDYSEPFLTCLRGFQPTNLCTIRMIKADLICGLQQGVAERLFRTDADWMVTGNYGVIQFQESELCDCKEYKKLSLNMIGIKPIGDDE